MSEFRAKDHRLSNPGYAEPPSETDRLIPDHRPTTAGVVSFLSSNERQGRWELSRRFRALAVLGNVELDLREAEIGIGLSVIEAVAVMGNIEITPPPDITVEWGGGPFIGTFPLQYEGTSPAMGRPDRVGGVAGTADGRPGTPMV